MTAHPEISVIITTYNRGDVLDITLKAWKRQTLRDFQLIVVDDGSTDNTLNVLQKYKEELGDKLTFLRVEHRGASYGRNKGVELARGDVIVFVDDDAYPIPPFLEAHLKWHMRYPNAIVRGPVINISSWHQLSERYPTSLTERLKHYSRNYFCTANASIRKHYLTEVGGFDTAFKRWEDTELAYRLRKRFKFKWIYEWRATVYHYKPESPGFDEVSYYQREGKYSAKVFLKYSDELRVRLRTGYFFPNTILWWLLLSDKLTGLVEGNSALRKLKYYVVGFLTELRHAREGVNTDDGIETNTSMGPSR